MRLYDEPGHWLNEDIKSRFNNPIYRCPEQQIYVGTMAPAIPGVNVFGEYYCRTMTRKIKCDKTLGTQYYFVIGFNGNDPVTGKFRVAAARLGSTTLAYKSTELAKTKALINNDSDIIVNENFSIGDYNRKLTTHSWYEYMNNRTHFEKFMQLLTR